LAVENKCWYLVRALIERGITVHKSYKQSMDFVLATDEEKAAETARLASVTALGSEGTSEWRGRFAASQVMDNPLRQKMQYIADGQTILDIEESGDGTDKASLLKCALREARLLPLVSGQQWNCVVK
jgi:hypothetical protein